MSAGSSRRSAFMSSAASAACVQNQAVSPFASTERRSARLALRTVRHRRELDLLPLGVGEADAVLEDEGAVGVRW